MPAGPSKRSQQRSSGVDNEGFHRSILVKHTGCQRAGMADVPAAIPDYYAVLEVTRSASEQEIRQSYRRLARLLHPDVNPQGEATAGSPDIRLVNEAWDVLGDPHRRAAYDRETRPAEAPEEGAPFDIRRLPVPDGFIRHPRPTWIGEGTGRRFRATYDRTYRDARGSFGSVYHWRYRAADSFRAALSLVAETRDLSNLSQLGKDDLWLLDVRDVPATDADLLAVIRFRRLEVLLLNGTRVTDAGLDGLSAIPTLRVLSLSDTRVTDQGTPAMASVPALEELFLYGTEVTNDGLAVFAAHPTLRVLDIRKTRVRGDGIRQFTGMPALRELRVSGWGDFSARRIFAGRRDVTIL